MYSVSIKSRTKRKTPTVRSPSARRASKKIKSVYSYGGRRRTTTVRRRSHVGGRRRKSHKGGKRKTKSRR